MKNLLSELLQRNKALYFFGWLNAAGVIICMLMIGTTATHVLGINAFIKPMKFFLSFWIFSWSMAWYMHLLGAQRKVKWFNLVVIITLGFEMLVIFWQAANGRKSHFNVTTPFYGLLFSLMGLAITVLVGWTTYIAILFFRQKTFNASISYSWGIRMGLVLFIIFSLQGFTMVAALSHTIGAPDGGPGLPIVNWSRLHGDLRIGHFLGMHALQLIPLSGYYWLKTKRQVIILSLIYFVIVSILLVQAFMGKPLIG